MKLPITRSRYFTLAILASTTAMTAARADTVPPNGDFRGITSGGPIAADDRIATDDLKTAKSSAQISNENDTISADFAYDWSLVGQQISSQDGRFVSTKLTTFSVKASIPLNGVKADDHVDFKSFGNNGKASISFNHYTATFIVPQVIQADVNRFARACITKIADAWMAAPHETTAPVTAQVRAVLDRFDAESASGLPTQAALFKIKDVPAEHGFGEAAFDSCKMGGTEGIGNDNQYATRYGIATLGRDGFAAWRRKYFDPQSSFFFGAQASIGYNKFSVVNRASFVVDSVDRAGMDISGHVGWISGNARLVVLADVGFTRSYEAKDSVDVCGPPDATGKTTCINGQDGLPDRKQTGYASVSLRKVLVQNAEGEPLVGVRPKVTYVWEDKDFQFELPLYLQRNDDGGLDAGIKALYNTGEKKFVFSAFVGVPF